LTIQAQRCNHLVWF